MAVLDEGKWALREEQSLPLPLHSLHSLPVVKNVSPQLPTAMPAADSFIPLDP